MRHIFEVFLNSLVAIGGWEGMKELRKRAEMPHRWKCPYKECSFRAQSSSGDVLHQVRKSHYESTHKDE